MVIVVGPGGKPGGPTEKECRAGGWAGSLEAWW